MKLHAPHWMRAVTDGVDLIGVVSRPRDDLERRRQPRRPRRSASGTASPPTATAGRRTGRFHRAGSRRLAMHHAPRSHHSPAYASPIDWCPRQTQGSHLRSPAGDEGHADPRLVGRAWARRDHDCPETKRSDLIDRDRIVAAHNRTLAQLAQILDEVVGERVVVVEDQDGAFAGRGPIGRQTCSGQYTRQPRGMKLPVDTPQVFAIDVRVDLRGRDVRVAEHVLHGAQVGTAFEQMGCERMAQRVRRQRAS